MTPLMITLVFWRATMSSHVAHLVSVRVRGALTKLNALGLVKVTSIKMCEYTLTKRGEDFISRTVEKCNDLDVI